MESSQHSFFDDYIAECASIIRERLLSTSFQLYNQPEQNVNFYQEILNGTFASDQHLFSILNLSSSDGIYRFLAPDGILFSYIDKLIGQNCKVQLPFYVLHEETQLKFKYGQLSEFTNRKIDYQQCQVKCDPFEYFFYRFFDHLFSALHFDLENFDQNVHHFVYTKCFISFLEYFLPNDRFLGPLLDNNDQKNQYSCLQQQNFSGLEHNSSETGLYNDFSRNNTGGTTSPFGLIKRQFLNQSQQRTTIPFKKGLSSSVATTLQQNITFLQKCGNMLQIMCDIWLSPAPNISFQSSVNIYQTVLLQSCLQQVFRFVYNNSQPEVSHAQEIAQFKQDLMGKLIFPNLDRFFDSLYNHWPLDSSYCYLSSLWLNYNKPAGVSLQPDFVEIAPNRQIMSKIFGQSLQRFLSTDLNSSKMLECLENFSTVFLKRTVNSVFIDSSFFMAHHESIVKLYRKLQKQRKITVLAQKIESKQKHYNQTSGVVNKIGSFVDFLLADPNDNQTKGILGEKNAKLNRCLTILADFLHFDENVDDSVSGPSHLNFTLPINPNHNDTMEMKEDFELSNTEPDRSINNFDGHLKLTPKGRWQIVNRLSTIDFMKNHQNNNFTTTPSDLLAPGQFEFSVLVHFWAFVSKLMDRRYGSDLTEVYCSEGFQSYFTKMLCYPPCVVKYGLDGKEEHLNARLPLRFMANYRFFFFYFFALFLLWLLFQVNPILFVSSSCLFLVICLLLVLFV